MKYFFDKDNLKVLEALKTKNTIYGFDFDGTLAPIVENRNEARLSSQTEKLVQEFISTETVAIITGRGRADIEEMTNLKPKYLIGNHGSEGLLSLEASGELQLTTKEFKNFILKHYWHQISDLKIEIEDKGYSLSLHYRNSPYKVEAEGMFSHLRKNLTEARFIEGKSVLNVLPQTAMSKGIAFQTILEKEKSDFGFYVGDDVTDEDVFALKDSRIIGIRVGEESSSAANYFIKDQAEINLLLEFLLKLKGS